MVQPGHVHSERQVKPWCLQTWKQKRQKIIYIYLIYICIQWQNDQCIIYSYKSRQYKHTYICTGCCSKLLQIIHVFLQILVAGIWPLAAIPPASDASSLSAGQDRRYGWRVRTRYDVCWQKMTGVGKFWSGWHKLPVLYLVIALLRCCHMRGDKIISFLIPSDRTTIRTAISVSYHGNRLA